MVRLQLYLELESFDDCLALADALRPWLKKVLHSSDKGYCRSKESIVMNRRRLFSLLPDDERNAGALYKLVRSKGWAGSYKVFQRHMAYFVATGKLTGEVRPTPVGGRSTYFQKIRGGC